MQNTEYNKFLQKVISLLFLITLCLHFSTVAMSSENLSINKNSEYAVHLTTSTTPTAYKPFNMQISICSDTVCEKSIDMEAVTVNLKMRMPMGNFNFNAVYDDMSGHYTVNNITLPKCRSGDREWIVTIKYTHDNQTVKVQRNLTLSK